MNMNMNELLKNAQKLQKEMMRQQEELATKEVSGSAGGDMVQVVMNGKFEVKRITLDPEVIRREDKEMLEDLIVSAVNNAVTKVRDETQKGVGDLMGKTGLPPGFPGL